MVSDPERDRAAARTRRPENERFILNKTGEVSPSPTVVELNFRRPPLAVTLSGEGFYINARVFFLTALDTSKGV